MSDGEWSSSEMSASDADLSLLEDVDELKTSPVAKKRDELDPIQIKEVPKMKKTPKKCISESEKSSLDFQVDLRMQCGILTALLLLMAFLGLVITSSLAANEEILRTKAQLSNVTTQLKQMTREKKEYADTLMNIVVQSVEKAPEDEFKPPQVVGEWKLLGSQNDDTFFATEFRTSLRRKRDCTLPNASVEFSFLDRGVYREQYFFVIRHENGHFERRNVECGVTPLTRVRIVRNCLVATAVDEDGWVEKTCVKQGLLQISERRKNVEWHRVYQKM